VIYYKIHAASFYNASLLYDKSPRFRNLFLNLPEKIWVGKHLPPSVLFGVQEFGTDMDGAGFQANPPGIKIKSGNSGKQK